MTEASTKLILRTTAKKRLAVNAGDRDLKSARIWKRLHSLGAFETGRVMVYLDFDFEVRTTSFLADFSGPVVVPYCDGNEIVPLAIEMPDELEPGRFGILEPKPAVRSRPERRVDLKDIDFVLVPGLAFDLSGNRLGRGGGFYDRFLARLSFETRVVALAFECQIFEKVPCEPHDRKVDLIVTEDRVIRVFRKSSKEQNMAVGNAIVIRSND